MIIICKYRLKFTPAPYRVLLNSFQCVILSIVLASFISGYTDFCYKINTISQRFVSILRANTYGKIESNGRSLFNCDIYNVCTVIEPSIHLSPGPHH